MNAMTPIATETAAPIEFTATAEKLSIRGLSHVYGNGVRALSDVNLDIPAGMFGLLGPNGAGKSTLMRIIATLQQPSAGQATFEGIDIVTDPVRLRRVLGYLPQEFGVYRRVSCEALLDHLAVLKGIGPKKLRREHVHSLLAQTNLYDVRKRAVATFSGGMRQRFGIAQALLGDPRLIIVDEPTAGLDPAERLRFHDLLAQIGEKAVVILSTHILEDVSRLCSRIAIILEGTVVAEGSPAALVESLRGRLWRKPVTAQTEIDALRPHVRVISTRYANGQTFVNVLSEQRPDASFEPVGGDLQDVYFATIAAEDRAAA